MSKDKALLVKVTIPARLISKEGGIDANIMRLILDDTYRVCLGRCEWTTDVVITGTAEQFGIFCALLKERHIGSTFPLIEVQMFYPIATPDEIVFDATGNQPKRITAPSLPVPTPTPCDVS